MPHASSNAALLTKIFNTLPIPAVVFFRKRGSGPMANDAARRLFGTQLAALMKPLLVRKRQGIAKRCRPMELPWRITMIHGHGMQCDDLMLPGPKPDQALPLKISSMPVMEHNAVIAAVVTFQEI